MKRTFVVLSFLSFAALTAQAAHHQDNFEDSPPFIMGALGDSITTAVNANGWGAIIEESWATGKSPSQQVKSHWQRLGTVLARPIEPHNVAQGGATAASLDGQLNQLLTVTPDYVTVLMGANDVCSWNDGYDEKIATYLQRMRKAVERMIAANHEVKIYLSPIPNLFKVWQVGNQHGCQWFWDLTNICAGMFHSQRTPAQRDDFVALIYQTNAGLESLAAEYPLNIKFDASLVDLPIAWAHISSYDCFHPSLAGQNMLAEKTWQTGWYAP